jgi:hypothetical protein
MLAFLYISGTYKKIVNQLKGSVLCQSTSCSYLVTFPGNKLNISGKVNYWL